nr:MAG TPA: hypothetical protein [Bacteriophage sp.]
MRLKIELKLEDNTVSGRVLEQDENLRKTANDEDLKLIISNADFLILSCFDPELLSKRLYVRGMDDHADDDTFGYSYDSYGRAESVYANIISLVNELNGELGGVVDERGNTLFVKDDAIGIIHHQEDRGADKDQSAKADKGKLELSLVNPELVKAVAEVRMYGTEKYGDSENWRKVEPKRYVDALYRHLLAYIEGNEVDEESGLSHLAHMACNISFLLNKEYLKEHESEV